MNLLLLLSAFLSALTGAITGAQPPAVRLHQAVAEARVAQAGAARVAAVPARPVVQALPLRVAIAGIGVLAPRVAFALIPLYASRRRE